MEVTYFSRAFENKHRYRLEDVQVPDLIEPGDEIMLPKKVREIGFDKPLKVKKVCVQTDQTDLLVEVSTELSKPLIHSKLEELCAEHEEYTAMNSRLFL